MENPGNTLFHHPAGQTKFLTSLPFQVCVANTPTEKVNVFGTRVRVDGVAEVAELELVGFWKFLLLGLDFEENCFIFQAERKMADRVEKMSTQCNVFINRCVHLCRFIGLQI